MNNENGTNDNTTVFTEDTTDIVTDAEEQIKFHQSEKETFSKGIASIIYNNNSEETEHVDQAVNIVDEDVKELDDEKNVSVEEIVQASETILVEDKSLTNDDDVKNEDQDELKLPKDDHDNQDSNKDVLAKGVDEEERKISENPLHKKSHKKSQNGMSKKGPRFTFIAGKKVDLNSEKPQYLKLTIEEIQHLAMQQRSERLKLDEEAEHYCAVHSPPRRRKVLQDKVKNGREKLNTLKMIEKNVEEGIKSPTSPVRSPISPIRSPTLPARSPTSPVRSPIAPIRTSKTTTEKSSINIKRSASLKMSSSTVSSCSNKSVKMMNGAQEASKVKSPNVHPMKKVTFNTNLEMKTSDKKETRLSQIDTETKTTTLRRSNSLPR